MSMAQMLQQSGVIESMARELDIDEQTARSGTNALLPALVAGMGRQTTAAPGAGGLGGLADALGGMLGGGAGGPGGGLAGGLAGGLGGGLGGMLINAVLHKDPTPTQPGNDILGNIFGSKDVSRGVAEEAAGSTGLDPALLKRMLPILAMAVMGMVMHHGQAAQPGQAGAAPSGGGGLLSGALGGIIGQVVNGMSRR